MRHLHLHISPSSNLSQQDAGVWHLQQQQGGSDWERQDLHQMHWTLRFVYVRMLQESVPYECHRDAAAAGGGERSHRLRHDEYVSRGLQWAP